MISFDKLHSADRSTSVIRRTITSKTVIMDRETLRKSREGIIVSLSSKKCNNHRESLHGTMLGVYDKEVLPPNTQATCTVPHWE
jgi:hypothetical protein